MSCALTPSVLFSLEVSFRVRLLLMGRVWRGVPLLTRRIHTCTHTQVLPPIRVLSVGTLILGI